MAGADDYYVEMFCEKQSFNFQGCQVSETGVRELCGYSRKPLRFRLFTAENAEKTR